MAEVVVLAEDIRQVNFVRRFVQRLDLGRVRQQPLPAGRQAGEQYVREQYSDQVKEYRRRASRRRAALIVVIDADTVTVQRRLDQLSRALAEAGQDDRGENETIVVMVPKRHIETWILCLTGDSADEQTNYRNLAGINERIKGAAVALFEWSRPNAEIPDECAPSLRRVIEEHEIARLAG